ncbi:OLC1v1023116C4 [Oldenlandia corymbosa var. corymbosa]|uniref:PRA1 family protein n=1 Tax=Oldenlandia corymbosa var. corymbosa TaxID=529605 RepID=A0AAV1C1Q4_OLDCO|nr:OLC1v1023116C4 [Oldenlandia corymbosa var. corymbosa]
MVFSSNPLALSVPDPAFESWLREKGYLEILDQRSSDLHRISTAAAGDGAAATSVSASSGGSDNSNAATHIPTFLPYGAFVSCFSYLKILISLLTLNPFAKLTNDDFAGNTPSWTKAFIGSFGSYSFPTSLDQARLRTHENVKRFARNYASLFILFLACSLYQMPIALVGLLLSLALWDGFKYCGDHWKLDQRPVLRQTLVRVAQCGKLLMHAIYSFPLLVSACMVWNGKLFLCIRGKRTFSFDTDLTAL